LPVAGRETVIYDLRGMRRPQDRAALCGSSAVPRSAALAIAIGAVALFGLLPSPSLAAQAGCGGKPGKPDNAALLQYCPEHKGATGGGEGGGTGVGGGSSLGPTSAKSAPSAASAHHAKSKQTGSHSEIPLTDYPSSGGINLLLILLIVIALGAAVAYGARRWRRSRPQTS
jgi:hypothetical protein